MLDTLTDVEFACLTADPVEDLHLVGIVVGSEHLPPLFPERLCAHISNTTGTSSDEDGLIRHIDGSIGESIVAGPTHEKVDS